jgi:hypothetical protein
MTSHIGGNFGKYTYRDHRGIMASQQSGRCLLPDDDGNTSGLKEK